MTAATNSVTSASSPPANEIAPRRRLRVVKPAVEAGEAEIAVKGQYFVAKCQCMLPATRLFPGSAGLRTCSAEVSLALGKAMKDRPTQEQLYQLSSQVTQLQLQLSLVLLELKRKPLQPVPVNDNAAGDGERVA